MKKPDVKPEPTELEKAKELLIADIANNRRLDNEFLKKYQALCKETGRCIVTMPIQMTIGPYQGA